MSPIKTADSEVGSPTKLSLLKSIVTKKTAPKAKPFNKMSPEEKKARIDYLWKRLRVHVKIERRFIKLAKEEAETNHLYSFVQENNFDWEQIRTQVIEEERLLNKLPWYLVWEDCITI